VIQVLALDGPARGSLIQWDDNAHAMQWPVSDPLHPREMVPLTPDSMVFEPSLVFEPSFTVWTYYLYHIRCFRRTIAVASVGLTEPSQDDAWDLVVTEKAKAAER
jgi:hypothetical protein